MDRTMLLDVVGKYGARVVSFSEYPEFFSSWRLEFQKNKRNYLFENDGRDGWMFLYMNVDAGRFEEMHRVESHCLSWSEILSQCEAWLSELP